MEIQLAALRRWFEGVPNAKLALFYGIGSGLLCLPANLVSRIACTACCPYRGLLGGLPLLFLPFLAALVVSLFADWRTISYDAAVRVGVKIGLLTGLVSAISGFVVIAFTEIAALILAAASVDTTRPQNIFEQIDQASQQNTLQLLIQVTVYTLIISAIFALIGFGLGILGGSLGAALKRSPQAK